MKILAIFTGTPEKLSMGSRETMSSINKKSRKGPVKVAELGLEGDQVADERFHGGIKKAVYAYGADTYPDWEKVRPENEFPFGAMGENLTLEVLKEDQCHIGDEFQVGSAIFKVSDARFPCFKLGYKYNDMKILNQFNELSRPGVYFSVIQDGEINVGDEFVLLKKAEGTPSVVDVFSEKIKRK